MDGRILYRLLSWLSPSYPVGAFTYSHGIETAVEEGLIASAASLADWLEDLLIHGTGRSDGMIFAAGYRALDRFDDQALADLAALALAFPPAKELLLESRNQGDAFFKATGAIWPCESLCRLRRLTPALPLPLVVAAACHGHGVELELGLQGYLHAFTTNLVSAGVRLIPLGQTQGLWVINRLEDVAIQAARSALAADLDELSSTTPLADWCSMRHETQYTRLFRS